MSISLDRSIVERLHGQAQAARWALTVEQFGRTLAASAAHAFEGRSWGPDDLLRYLESLNLEDLALAAACAAGHETAWEHFVREHRQGLYRAADAIDPTGGARDLADSLYADLFGLDEREGSRRSLFRYFHGRSRLATWLRAVLSQRHVDRIRTTRRAEPLPDDESASAIPSRTGDVDPERPRLVAAVEAALATAIADLEPRDRLRLSCYYVQGLKLAAIGRLLGEHEATVSRHLTRTRADIQAAVEEHLRSRHGMDAAAIRQGLDLVLDDPGRLDLAKVVGATPAAARMPAGIVQK